MNIIDRIESGELTMSVYEHPLGRSYKLDWATKELLRLAKLGQAAETASNEKDNFYDPEIPICLPGDYPRRSPCVHLDHPCKWQNFCKTRSGSDA
jgi:hypothetical protein